jgi:hypothetical protein
VLSSSSVGFPVHHGADSLGEAQAKEETHAPMTKYAGQSTRIVVTLTTARNDDYAGQSTGLWRTCGATAATTATW